MSDRLDSALGVLAREPVDVSWGDVERRRGRPGPAAELALDLDLESTGSSLLGGSGLRRRLPLLAVAALLVLVGLVALVPGLQDEPEVSPADSGPATSVADPPITTESGQPAAASRPLLPPLGEVALPALPLVVFVAVAAFVALSHQRSTLGSGGRPRSRLWWLVGVLAVAVVAAAWLWETTAPDDVFMPSGTVGFDTLAPGESLYIGYDSLSERDLVIGSVTPATLNDLRATVWMCHRRPGTNTIGAVAEDDLAGHCESFQPFTPGSTVRGRGPGQPEAGAYLVVQITSTSPNPQGMCGLDITYRPVDGWRSGRTIEGGSHRVVINAATDHRIDELLARCSNRT